MFTIFYKLFLYPVLFSPLRSVPGPPFGHPLWGQFATIIQGEAGIPQRGWVKEYGPIVRAIGPFGLERLIFMKPEACHKILVSDWVEYPRVCPSSSILAFIKLKSISPNSCEMFLEW